MITNKQAVLAVLSEYLDENVETEEFVAKGEVEVIEKAYPVYEVIVRRRGRYPVAYRLDVDAGWKSVEEVD